MLLFKCVNYNFQILQRSLSLCTHSFPASLMFQTLSRAWGLTSECGSVNLGQPRKTKQTLTHELLKPPLGSDTGGEEMARRLPAGSNTRPVE